MKKVIAVLLSILIALTAFLIFLMFRLNDAITVIGQDIAASFESETEAADSGVEAQENGLFKMYKVLYDNLDEYGLTDQYGQDSTDLANVILNRTIKTMEITDIQYEEDGFIVVIEGDGVPFSAINEDLITNAVTAAARKYLASHFLDLAGMLLQGKTDEIKEMLFSRYGDAFFATLEQEVEAIPAGRNQQIYKISTNESGQMSIEEMKAQ